MKSLCILTASAAILLLLSGCASTEAVYKPNPTSLGVDEALTQIGSGLNNMREKMSPHAGKSGMLPDTIEVVLNVTANASDSTKLVVDANASTPPTPAIPVSAGVGVTSENLSAKSATRSNQIRVTFKSTVFGSTTEQTSTTTVKEATPITPKETSVVVKTKTESGLVDPAKHKALFGEGEIIPFGNSTITE